jgi:RNA recognition motif-containing protein
MMHNDLEHYEGHENNPRLYIGNLDYRTTVQDVRKIFGKYGEIVAIQIKTGFCFVEYEKPLEAKHARESMNLKNFNGRTIIARPACKIKLFLK